MDNTIITALQIDNTQLQAKKTDFLQLYAGLHEILQGDKQAAADMCANITELISSGEFKRRYPDATKSEMDLLRAVLRLYSEFNTDTGGEAWGAMLTRIADLYRSWRSATTPSTPAEKDGEYLLLCMDTPDRSTPLTRRIEIPNVGTALQLNTVKGDFMFLWEQVDFYHNSSILAIQESFQMVTPVSELVAWWLVGQVQMFHPMPDAPLSPRAAWTLALPIYRKALADHKAAQKLKGGKHE
jgi:hypothetical protein